MQQAYSQANAYIEEATRQAQEILDKATVDANNYRLAAIQYTDEMLGNLSKIIQHTSETAAAKYENFVTSLNNCLEVVEMNRRELAPQHKEAQEALGFRRQQPFRKRAKSLRSRGKRIPRRALPGRASSTHSCGWKDLSVTERIWSGPGRRDRRRPELPLPQEMHM